MKISLHLQILDKWTLTEFLYFLPDQIDCQNQLKNFFFLFLNVYLVKHKEKKINLKSLSNNIFRKWLGTMHVKFEILIAIKCVYEF